MIRMLLFSIVAMFALGLLTGCDEEDILPRKPATAAQNTPEWLFYHNYQMFLHESEVLEEALNRGRAPTRSSWGRLREYLVGMSDNMPQDNAFEFITITNAYDTEMAKYLEKNGNQRVAFYAVEDLNKKVKSNYKPEIIYPDWKVEDGKK